MVVAQTKTEPDYGKAGEFLFSILRSLLQVFEKDEDKKGMLESGMELVKENKLPEADKIIT